MKTEFYPNQAGEVRVTIEEIAFKILDLRSATLERVVQMRIAENLKKIGFKRKPSNGINWWVYQK